MGTGKTTIGRQLAEQLGWPFVDLDEEIERRAERSIPEIFSQQGEPRFRSIETDALRQVSAGLRQVIALGGGAFCSLENRRIIEAAGRSVWLRAPLGLIMARCRDNPTRPLFKGRRQMAALLASRTPAYGQADFHIDVSKFTAATAAAEILRQLGFGPNGA
jgi:shikimate kinase